MEGITHKYTVKKLIQVNDGSGTVIKVEYEVETIDGDFKSTMVDDVMLESPSTENFIEYEDLTEEIVIQWIKNIHGEKNEIRNLQIIAYQKNPPKPPTVDANLPWQ